MLILIRIIDYNNADSFYLLFVFVCQLKKVGDRCQVEQGKKRGTVKFVGLAETLAPGFWVGIQYDEPLGKHDGMCVHVIFYNNVPIESIKINVLRFIRGK